MGDGKSRRILWGLWLLATIGLAAWLANTMLTDTADKRVFMPGEMTAGHHQLQQACAVCHGDPLGGGEVLQQACIDCHGDVRRKPFDSHPASKFRDPRNADRLGNIDALHCVSCHSEHRPEITRKNGVTQPRDLCIHCHEDIAADRPSHRDMAFTTCTTGGCHNFHDNRSLYTKFLITHLDEAETLPEPVVPAREFAQLLDQITGYPLQQYPLQVLSAQDADDDLPDVPEQREQPLADWAATAHARSGVNCSACHQPQAQDGTRPAWTDHPDQQVCSTCHNLEVERFGKGKHGMRLAAGLPALHVSDARLPMRADAAHESLGCNSCHVAHRYDVRQAAAEACMNCHEDTHTLAYRDSPHAALWRRELNGESPAGSGVSCATCHMPRIDYDVNDWLARIMVDHNQSANLSPNSKMIRSACLHCHGLEFSIDALADAVLIENNFNGRPSGHVQTMDLAAQERERRDSEEGDDDNSMFGF
jgi:hypothetical protein